MKPYVKVDVSEQQLEDLVRRHAGMIEGVFATLITRNKPMVAGLMF